MTSSRAHPSSAVRSVLALLYLVPLAGCLDNGPILERPDAGDAGAPRDAGVDAGHTGMDGGLPLDGACDALVSARCDALVRCGLYDDEADGGRSRCEAIYGATWCGPTTWPSRVERGTLTYDPLRAEDCLMALMNRACDDVLQLPDACNRYLLPHAQLKQQCYGGFDECVEGVCRGGTCPRTCQARGLAGETCHRDSDCKSVLYCRLLPTTPGIGVCAAWGMSSDTCDEAALCGQGLVCDQSFCALLPSANMECLKGQCEDTSWCSDADGGTCLTRKNRGASCADAGECLAGLVCEPLTGQCEAAELTQAGSPCGLLQTCPTGTTCVGVTPRVMGVCQAPLAEGFACGAATDCEAHLTCVPADGGRVCGQRRAVGEACDTNRDCRSDGRCKNGLCRALPFTGEDCTLVHECAYGRCQDFDGGPSKCLPAAGPGGLCNVDRDCASGWCVLGVCAAACNP